MSAAASLTHVFSLLHPLSNIPLPPRVLFFPHWRFSLASLLLFFPIHVLSYFHHFFCSYSPFSLANFSFVYSLFSRPPPAHAWLPFFLSIQPNRFLLSCFYFFYHFPNPFLVKFCLLIRNLVIETRQLRNTPLVTCFPSRGVLKLNNYPYQRKCEDDILTSGSFSFRKFVNFHRKLIKFRTSIENGIYFHGNLPSAQRKLLQISGGTPIVFCDEYFLIFVLFTFFFFYWQQKNYAIFSNPAIILVFCRKICLK